MARDHGTHPVSHSAHYRRSPVGCGCHARSRPASGTALETRGGGAYCWGWSQHPPRQVCRNDGGRQGVFEQGVRTKGREAHDMTACAEGDLFIYKGEHTTPKEQPYTADMMKKIADFDPKIIELNNQVLFGDIWE